MLIAWSRFFVPEAEEIELLDYHNVSTTSAIVIDTGRSLVPAVSCLTPKSQRGMKKAYETRRKNGTSGRPSGPLADSVPWWYLNVSMILMGLVRSMQFCSFRWLPILVADFPCI